MNYQEILKKRLKERSESLSENTKNKQKKTVSHSDTGKKETVLSGNKSRKPLSGYSGIYGVGSGENTGKEEPEEKSLHQQKQEEDLRKVRIQNEKELRNLIGRDLMISIIGELGQSIQNNIVDQAKRNAPTWAAKLGIPEKEREIEKMLSYLGEEEINGVISDVEKFCSKEIYEG